MESESCSQHDSSLISQFKSSGELHYLSLLYRRYMPLVYGVCLKYLQHREEAQDAVMDIFEKLSHELKKHDIPVDFKPWLYVVVKNFCLMKLRKSGQEQHLFKNITPTLVENLYFEHPIDEEQEKQSEALQRCMKALKEYQHQCVKLFYYENMCYREIANKLQSDEKKVKSGIQNGKRNLKICIEKHSV